MKGDRTQGQERLADSAHVRDIGLKPARREKHAQFAIVIHITGRATCADRLSCDTSDKCADLKVAADADSARLVRDTKAANVNIFIACGEI